MRLCLVTGPPIYLLISYCLQELGNSPTHTVTQGPRPLQLLLAIALGQAQPLQLLLATVLCHVGPGYWHSVAQAS